MIKNKNILLVIPDESEIMELCSWFTRDNYTKVCYTEEEGYEFLEKNRDIISVVVLDYRLAKQSEYEYVKKVCNDPRFASIPIIAISPETAEEEDMVCLEYGVSDLITPPCPWELMSRRIYNAVRAKDSATFYEIEAMLKKLPCNIFLKDKEGKYVFSTQYWHHLNKRNDPNWTIRGKTDIEIRKDKENAMKAFEADKQILKTGKGTKYIIEESDEVGHEFLEISKEAVFDADGKIDGIVALIIDVTEREILKREVKKAKEEAEAARQDAERAKHRHLLFGK